MSSPIEHVGFTPGPWEAIHIWDNQWNVRGPKDPHYRAHDFMEADARLMADAPNLLAQLTAAQAEIEELKAERNAWKRAAEILAETLDHFDVGDSEIELTEAHAQAVKEAQEKTGK